MSWIVLHVELCLEDPRPGCEHNHLNRATIPPIEPATDRAHRTPQAPCTRAAAPCHQPRAPGASRPYARARAHPACSPLGYLQHGGMGLHRLSPPCRKNFISNGDPIPSIVYRATSPWPLSRRTSLCFSPWSWSHLCCQYGRRKEKERRSQGGAELSLS
jgi:hypothetical protein